MAQVVGRYSAGAIVLHWTIAAAILLQIAIGWRMEALEGLAKFQAFQWHKSVGITILLLTLARIAWRLTHRPPPFAQGVRGWRHALASGVHVAFYALLLALPLTGWVLVSASPYNLPTLLYGVIPWPHLPGLPELAAAEKKAVGETFGAIHGLLVWSTLALLALHVAGALKHTIIDRDGTLWRMAPVRRTA